MPVPLEHPLPLKDHSLDNKLNNYSQSARPMNNFNIPLQPGLPVTECETHLDNLTLRPQEKAQPQGKVNRALPHLDRIDLDRL